MSSAATSFDTLKATARSADPWEILGPMRRILEGKDLDYSTARILFRIVRLARKTSRAQSKNAPGAPLRLAVLAGQTSAQLAWALDLYLTASGFECELYESPFGAWRQDILNPQSGLYDFAPNVLILAPGSDAAPPPAVGASEEEVAAAIERELSGWRELWRPLAQAAIQVVQDDFVLPSLRPLGRQERNISSSPSAFYSRLNQGLRDEARGHVNIHDLDHLASWVGKRQWFDERLYHHSKQACALEAIPVYASSLAALVGALRGRSRRCLILDLDNTLWGGVIGDDGLEAIRLGQGSPEGEAFAAFQRYALSLRARGVVLAVCSKNENATARRAFEDHPDMVLRLSDIAVFVANWKDKAHNIRSIARQLELGLDAMVFVDDNPAERELVRAELPEVAVPELPEDPADYAGAIDRLRYFEAAAFTDDDTRRADYYAGNAKRAQAREASASDLEGFLAGLEMVSKIREITPLDLSRSTQLINKTNQFNLTLQRMTIAEVQQVAGDPRYLARTVRLRDRLGDNGLISVVIGRIQEDTLRLELWLMSCRVLSRGVEEALFLHLWNEAKARGLERLRGVYIPGPRNALVQDHYQHLGFTECEPDSSDPQGAKCWEFRVAAEPPQLRTFIQEEHP